MSTIVYGIPNCSTVKKARAWLDARGAEYVFHDYKKHGVPADRLNAWVAEAGWEKLLNRQGTTWRKFEESIRAGVTDADTAKAVMMANPSVIKRPVIEQNGRVVSVGFDATAESAAQSHFPAR